VILRFRTTRKITSDFAQQESCSPLPANSDEYSWPFDPTHSEFVGRGAGGEGTTGNKNTAPNQNQIQGMKRNRSLNLLLLTPQPPLLVNSENAGFQWKVAASEFTRRRGAICIYPRVSRSKNLCCAKPVTLSHCLAGDMPCRGQTNRRYSLNAPIVRSCRWMSSHAIPQIGDGFYAASSSARLTASSEM
jgi:hypothetical protein